MAMDMKEMIKWTIADLVTRQASQEGPKEAGKKAAQLVTPNILKKMMPKSFAGGKVVDTEIGNAQGLYEGTWRPDNRGRCPGSAKRCRKSPGQPISRPRKRLST